MQPYDRFIVAESYLDKYNTYCPVVGRVSNLVVGLVPNFVVVRLPFPDVVVRMSSPGVMDRAPNFIAVDWLSLPGVMGRPSTPPAIMGLQLSK